MSLVKWREHYDNAWENHGTIKERHHDELATAELYMFNLRNLLDEARMVGMDEDSVYHLIAYEAELDKINAKIKKGLWYIQSKQYKTPRQRDAALKKLDRLRGHRRFTVEQVELVYEEYENLKEMM